MSLASDLETRLTAVWTILARETAGELSRTSASVLTMLAERSHRVTELADAQAVAQPTMTVLLKRLETRGLLVREQDHDDRRATNAVITDAGREALARRRASRTETLARRLRRLDPEARAAIAAALPALDDLLSA
jgi:DNA-binding MarR family transcriptional regulator